MPITDIGAEDVFTDIYNGSLLSDTCNQDREVFYGAYVQNLLQHDIKMATPVSDEMKFYRFMCNVAANVGNAVDISSLASKLWQYYKYM